jgi:hypothetical protein
MISAVKLLSRFWLQTKRSFWGWFTLLSGRWDLPLD